MIDILSRMNVNYDDVFHLLDLFCFSQLRNEKALETKMNRFDK